jgi:acetyltransferase
MDGDLTVRPLVSEDEAALTEFHRGLSERSIRYRYFHALKLEALVDHDAFVRECLRAKDGSTSFVAERTAGGAKTIVGVARLTVLPGGETGEFAIVVADRWQHRGFGRTLMRRLIEFGESLGLVAIVGDVLPDNIAMQRLCRRLGFRIERPPDEPIVKVRLVLAKT